MKKSLAHFSLLLITLLISSCSSSESRIRTTSLENYNLKGNIESIEVISYVETPEGEKINTSSYIYEFNQGGMVTKQTYLDEMGSIMRYIIYSYDSDNNPIEENSFDIDNNLVARTTHKYSNGIISLTNFYNEDGVIEHNLAYKNDGVNITESTDPSGCTTKYYWKSGRIAKDEYITEQNDTLAVNTYNEKGAILVMSNPYVSSQYKYNKNDDPISLEVKEKNGGTYDDSYTFEYEYDANQNYTKMIERKKGIENPTNIIERTIIYRK